MKKKIILLTAFISVLVAGLYNAGSEDVKAATCKTYTNYYLFVEPHGADRFRTEFEYENGTFGNDTFVSSKFTKTFDLPLPGEAVDHGLVSITGKSAVDGDKSMSLRTFHEKFMAAGDNEILTDGDISYIRARSYEENGEPSTDEIWPPETYSDFEAAVPDNLKYEIDLLDDYDENGVTFTIQREWNVNDYDFEEAIESWDATEKTPQIFSPAAYYVEYKVCEEDYNVNVHYIKKSTGDEFEKEIVEEGLEDGETYDAYTCPSEYTNSGVNYVLTKEDKSSYESGTIDGEDVDLYCYYEEAPVKKNVTLTIKYGTNKNCTEGTDIRKTESKDYTEGTKINFAIPEISGYEFSEVGEISPSFTTNLNKDILSFNMPSKNTSVCLVYIKNPQTGAGWIYLAWIIGIMALGYSGWYFNKYYKNQNNEI